MKFPSHVILDVVNSNNLINRNYWHFFYFTLLLNHMNLFFIFSFFTYFLKKKKLFLNFLLKNQKKFTICYKQHKAFKSTLNILTKKKKKFMLTTKYLIVQKFARFNLNFFARYFTFEKTQLFNNAYFFFLFDINFLKKEKIYTKLKYSRVPQYDVVSGGSAALFAGFLGFLICEKFGFELLDSGDFYILFMYVVFLCFSLRLLIKLLSDEQTSWNIVSLKYLLNYIKVVITLPLKNLYNFI